MTIVAPPPPSLVSTPPLQPSPGDGRRLWRELLLLAGPVWVEQSLHMLVGLNDTYLANHLPQRAADAGAAVGTITYFLWFIGLLVGSVGTGSTAIISRARGARHRRLANRVVGQSVTAAVLLGIVIGVGLIVLARPVVALTELRGDAPALALPYLRMLSVTLPFTRLMFIAGSCQRGGGDSVTPAVVMVAVDVVNLVCSFALCRGWFGLPVMGFNGIALGTVIAYVCGGLIQLAVLLRGTGGGARLHLHRLRPHWDTVRRLFRIGLPAGVEGLLQWVANFGVIGVINGSDPTNVMSSAHVSVLRIEAVSYLSGMSFATAAATLVGTELGRRDPARAARAARYAFLGGGGVMVACGLLFIFLGRYPAEWIAPADPRIIRLTATCLSITGCIQAFFAAQIIFGGALRGAGDTKAVMTLSLASIFAVRFVGVGIVGLWLHRGLAAVWVVLCVDQVVRGLLIYARFRSGQWRQIEV
jgi:putative MATE family efflux protein